MDADRIHLSQVSAEIAAQAAITQKRADAYRVRPATVRNPDRTIDRGFAAIIMMGGKTVGFA